MKIKKIDLKNFRLLENISCNIEDDITLIVGKNNTGKTSFFEAIKLATSQEGKFQFEDFSQETYKSFESNLKKYNESQKDDIDEESQDELQREIINGIPKIQVVFEIEYDKVNDSLIELSEFITDLEDARNDALICISFEPTDALRMFKSFCDREDENQCLIKYLQKNINNHYRTKCYAVDKNSDYKREIEEGFKRAIEKVFLVESIKAMRVLDDTNDDSNNSLSEGFSKYYKVRDKESGDVKELEKELEKVAENLKGKYEKVLEAILEELKKFGAKTPITVPQIAIDSRFDSEKVIKKNIHYLYQQDVIDLPESYNGLGYSNLIYMILELASFIEKFKNSKEEKLTNFITVLIEEPEAHMHPQMQQVFISQISELVKEAKSKNNLSIQIILTTHSSHILSEAGIDKEKGFSRVRYFNRQVEKDTGITKIINQDFNNLKVKDDKRTFRFLKQYLTLHKSDLFFADKVILVEGSTERMLLPQMIKKVAFSLEQEYVSVLEVGGAYAHLFKELLEFIGVKTLVITDIDSAHKVQKESKQEVEKCPVIDGTFTTNETLKQWIPRKTNIADLTALQFEQKQIENIRVAYQTKENGFNARSLEDAFINTNKDFLLSEYDPGNGSKKTVKNLFSYLKRHKLNGEIPAPSDSKVKTNFTFDIMCFDEEAYGEWQVPEYISEGLKWLAENN
ncbi:ATP-dependent nuclease [Marinifilum flexuosum]|uniref:ATP-dependent nuclease n=1 Tax=Marinifilum flexuosum TaxID=1117708 RepID=UPI0024940590|nr:AAA family ATPase [Marinifilum flexuosum]